jgi:hypothetical protein
METRFHIGDYVRCVNSVSDPEKRNAKGIITSVRRTKEQNVRFHVYEVWFPFGVEVLDGTQLESYPPVLSPTLSP